MVYSYTRSIFTFFSVVCLSVFAQSNQASANSCSCLPLPIEGAYSGAEYPFMITYLDDGSGTFGSNDEAPDCPKKMRIESKRHEGPVLDTVLTCDPVANEWKGIEKTKWKAKKKYINLEFGWTLRGTENGAKNPITDGLAAATETVEFDLVIPKIAKASKKKDRKNIKLQLAGSGYAAPCLCQAVRLELAYVNAMRDAYGDPKNVSDAEYAGIRGMNINFDHWLDDTGTLNSLPQRAPKLTFQKMIQELVQPKVQKQTNSQKNRTKNATAQAKASQKKSNASSGAFASVNPGSCQITPPNKKEVIKQCIPGIVVSAAMQHEQVHKNRCESLNKRFPEYIYKGKKINWKKESEAHDSQLVVVEEVFHGVVGDVPLPPNAYVAWTQKPAHHALDEFEAYTVEAKMLQKWLGEFCP